MGDRVNCTPPWDCCGTVTPIVESHVLLRDGLDSPILTSCYNEVAQGSRQRLIGSEGSGLIIFKHDPGGEQVFSQSVAVG